MLKTLSPPHPGRYELTTIRPLTESETLLRTVERSHFSYD